MAAAITSANAIQQRHHALATPREHGAWGMLLVPLATGAAVGLLHGGKLLPVLWLTVAVLALFWLRTPLESYLGTSLIRARSDQERRWLLRPILLAGIAASLAAGLLLLSAPPLPLLGMAGAGGVILALQSRLNKRGRTTRMAAQMVGALALCLTAPAALCASTERTGTLALMLWLLNWLFAMNQIHYVQTRIRSLKLASATERIQQARWFLADEAALLVALFAARLAGLLPVWTLIAFLPALLRGVSWIFAHAEAPSVRRLGLQELSYAIGFGVLLVLAVA